MNNHDIARVLDEVADMLEILGENFFRVRAYQNAARVVADYPEPLESLAVEQLDDIPGIGADLAGKIVALVKTGQLDLHRELQGKVPPGLLELRTIRGLGPKRIKILADIVKVTDRTSLKRAAEAGALRGVRGLGKKLEEQVLAALLEQSAPPPERILYAEAERIAAELMAHLKECGGIEAIEAAGSFRRRRDTVGDLDLLVASTDAAPIMDRFVAFPGVASILGKGETKSSIVLSDGLQVDLRVVESHCFAAALMYFTGSKAHNVRLRRIAQTKDMLLNEYGLFAGDKPVAATDEESLYRALGLDYVVPELREDRGEVEAAEEHHLPKLITREDLRGDLHSHSTWTDGRASIEEMARAAKAAGLEYFALTDHSQRLAMARGLDADRLRKQWREIEAASGDVGIRILRGVEVDILEDGSLDLSDDILAELDWVVASVHSKLEMDSHAMTDRILTAIRNRNVDVLGHPSGRLINKRMPSQFDLDEVLHVAREEGCALEVDSQPRRLDLNDAACLAAKHAGVKLVVSSDAHHPSHFERLVYGINQARRGWIEAGDVLNTQPFDKFRQRR